MTKRCDLRNIELMLTERGIDYTYGFNGNLLFKREDGREFIVGNTLGFDGYSVFCTCYSAHDAMQEIFGDEG